MSPNPNQEAPAGIGDKQLNFVSDVLRCMQPAPTTENWEALAKREGQSVQWVKEKFNYYMHKIKALDDYNNGKKLQPYVRLPKPTGNTASTASIAVGGANKLKRNAASDEGATESKRRRIRFISNDPGVKALAEASTSSTSEELRAAATLMSLKKDKW